MSNNPGDGKNPRRARKPQGFFSEKQQEQRNEAARDVKSFLDYLKTDYSKKRLKAMPPRPPKQKWRPVKTAIVLTFL
ncbi:hypothetical protein PENNAL_c0005G01212 [Penicillium nalgiovense]|uniref:Uncharacterized protein n=1 Tax=Penicillium nalgiovense TaxID=60175 RepID=A0A1V6Z1K8_PENNA|nr:hypothetical protein PENNAL_c0005G01212 [Penicillium nalgiovense]